MIAPVLMTEKRRPALQGESEALFVNLLEAALASLSEQTGASRFAGKVTRVLPALVPAIQLSPRFLYQKGLENRNVYETLRGESLFPHDE